MKRKFSAGEADFAFAINQSDGSAPLILLTSAKGWLLDLGSNQGPMDYQSQMH